MQLLLNSKKFLILTVLSSSLLLASYDVNMEVSGLVPINWSSDNTENTNANQADSIWSALQQDLKLDHKAQSAEVKAEIRKILADQGKLREILEAATPYIYFILQQTQARGLPAELALIPVIESEFNPKDRSKKGATGIWQLMPQTARELGVKVKSKYDGRRNIIASTHAALAYFNDLGNNFKGNWYLAIAAYNCGQGKIESAIRKIGSRSFWSLSLPRETKYYVPKLLAVAAIIKNPEKYGIELPVVTNEPYFTELKIKKAVSLEQISKSSGIELETLKTLNPDYNHDVIANKGAYSLLVPVDKELVVKSKLADKIIIT